MNSWVGQGPAPQGAERRRPLTPEPPVGLGKEGQAAAVSAHVPGRWRQRPRAPALRARRTRRSVAQPVFLPPGRPDRAALRAPCALGALGLGSRRCPTPPARPAAVRAMTLTRVRAGAWAAAARVAQRRRRVEGAGRSPSPGPRSPRAALYVHVSGEREAGQGHVCARGPEVSGAQPRSDL